MQPTTEIVHVSTFISFYFNAHMFVTSNTINVTPFRQTMSLSSIKP